MYPGNTSQENYRTEVKKQENSQEEKHLQSQETDARKQPAEDATTSKKMQETGTEQEADAPPGKARKYLQGDVKEVCQGKMRGMWKTLKKKFAIQDKMHSKICRKSGEKAGFGT